MTKIVEPLEILAILSLFSVALTTNNFGEAFAQEELERIAGEVAVIRTTNPKPSVFLER